MQPTCNAVVCGERKRELRKLKEEEEGMSPTSKVGGAVSSATTQAELLRQDGNTYFKKERFGAAIDAYTEAITLCPNVAVYWTNRALCFRKKSDWKRVEDDCRKALQLDINSVKGHYMLGLALLQKQEYVEGVKQLEKALDLGRGANPRSYIVEEIWQELGNAKYLEWEDGSSKRSWHLQNLKETCEKALEEQYLLDTSQAGSVTEEAVCAHLSNLEFLGQIFEKAAEADTPKDVPDYLCCKITLDIFRDPVITPSGVTYERRVLIDHLQKVGAFDPITREPLDQSQLIPNLAVKEAVQAFLKEHGWAYKID